VASAFFPGGVPLELLVAVYVGWIAAEIVGGRIVPRWRAQGAREVARADRGSQGEIFSGVFVSVLVVALFAEVGLATFPLVLVYCGLALMAAGVAVRQWAIAVLGRYFSPTVRLLEDHRVVAQGPYRFVRHPSYTGMILTLVGLGLAGGSWEGLLAVAVLAGVIFGYRIHVEERFLVGQLGPEYEAYRRRTKRIFPFLL
jgi:protein-S-isoprenylcysteine O-methyltransferase Ste14